MIPEKYKLCSHVEERVVSVTSGGSTWYTFGIGDLPYENSIAYEDVLKDRRRVYIKNLGKNADYSTTAKVEFSFQPLDVTSWSGKLTLDSLTNNTWLLNSGTSGFIPEEPLHDYSGYSGYSAWTSTSGYSGVSGYSGSSGWTTASGYTGVSGYSGLSGWTAESGYTGVLGDSGYSGYDEWIADSGYTGESGYTGMSGWWSDSGYTGISGYSGTSGWTSTSGYSGVSGYSGSSGWTTTSGYLDNTVNTIVAFPTAVSQGNSKLVTEVTDQTGGVYKLKLNNSVGLGIADKNPTADTNLQRYVQVTKYKVPDAPSAVGAKLITDVKEVIDLPLTDNIAIFYRSAVSGATFYMLQGK